jgi:glycosyltransferase involved in cell wall biosynthesis
MACGTPVLTSNVSALPETAGEAAILVDPSSTEEIARGIRDLIGSAELRDRLRAAGLARAHSFSWRRTAEGTLAVYARVLGRRP